MCVARFIHMCDTTHPHVVRNDEVEEVVVSVTWLIYVCGMVHSWVWHDSSTCVMWRREWGSGRALWARNATRHSREWGSGRGRFVCDMTHSCVWHGSFMCVTRLIRMSSGMRQWKRSLYVWQDSFMCVAWFIHVCDMTHPHVWCDDRNEEAGALFVRARNATRHSTPGCKRTLHVGLFCKRVSITRFLLQNV